MPLGDGTGPRGMGSLTGRGMGFCAGYPVAGSQNPAFGRGFKRGFGGFGGRGNRGRRNSFNANAFNYGNMNNYTYNEITPEQEAEMLKVQAKHLQSSIDELNRRISELEEISTQK